MKTFPIVLREQRFPWLLSLRASDEAPLPMSVFLSVIIGAVEGDIEDVVYEEPYHEPDLTGMIHLEGKHFAFEQRGVVYVSGVVSSLSSGPWPSLDSLHRTGDAGDFAELDPDFALERGGFHVHPTMLATAIGEQGRHARVVRSVERVTLGRRCGAWCWIHTNENRESVVLYDHAAEMVARLEGIATADAFAYDRQGATRLRRAANG